MSARNLTPIDQFVTTLDQGLRTVFGAPKTTGRVNPADAEMEADLSDEQRVLAERLMRINHAGEVSAQGLYQGQALTAKLPQVRQKMARAAAEENDHLAWCKARLDELGGRPSYLNPVWFAGSVAIGAVAGLVGDKWSLGFVAETERQVEKHLDGHLGRLPGKDAKSLAILKQMRADEIEHGNAARHAGAADLPTPVKTLMGLVSKVMTRTAYWL